MNEQYILSTSRQLTEEEKALVWSKPSSHRDSAEEIRICNEIKRNWKHGEMKIANILLEGDAGSGKTQLAKALSADFGLPYTKVTCFADMDKSDIIGAILPVLSDEQQESMETVDKEVLGALYRSDNLSDAALSLSDELGVSHKQAGVRIRNMVKALDQLPKTDNVSYRFYPSEIVRAFRNGYLLEIQEPTVIRDAAMLMALNSALEPDGIINLPTEVIHRHHDFIAVITTNRGYNGCRPLNEALRDRIQHAERMDMPSIDVMIERATAKTGYTDRQVLSVMANAIIVLDQTARANAIKGVAGMRSYFYWIDAVAYGADVKESLYHKVIYKITTDPDEIRILEEALEVQGIISELNDINSSGDVKKKQNCLVIEIHTWDDCETSSEDEPEEDDNAIMLRKAANSEGHSDKTSEETQNTRSSDFGEFGNPNYHQMDPNTQDEKRKEQEFRKQLNQDARKTLLGTTHHGIKLIIHRPEVTLNQKEEYKKLSAEISPVIRELVRKTMPLLEHEVSVDFSRHHVYGTRFHAESIASKDFRFFAKKSPPEETPSLAVALRIDESASMCAFGRLNAAKRAAIAVYEFCDQCGIPLLIYGDTADRSKIEQMSVYAYSDFAKKEPDDCFRLMNIQGRSNNRDGMALRILSEKLLTAPKQTKLLISISDGQPKATPDYTGSFAVEDMQNTIKEYTRKGITFVAAAIGQDKDIISRIYGKDRFLDITDLNKLPTQLVKIITRYL